MRPSTGRSLDDLVLLAAKDLAAGELERDFPAERLLVEVWKQERQAFGLRGYENEHPDANKLYTKLDGKKGLVARGLLEKTGERRLRLTRDGLASALRAADVPDTEVQTKLNREITEGMESIIDHPEFQAWLRDPQSPSRFRGAGHFWGIAPGTQPDTVYRRITQIDRLLDQAEELLKASGATVVASQRGKPLFDGETLTRLREFQRTLKDRFARDLKTLDPRHEY